MIDEEQRQIDLLKTKLDDEVRRNEELEADCLQMESKVKLVLAPNPIPNPVPNPNRNPNPNPNPHPR